MPDSAPDFRPLRRRVPVGYKSTIDLMTAAPERPNGKADILLLHGAYSNAGVWAENFLPYLASRGFTAHALSFRGHGASDGDREAWRFGLDDFVADARAALKLIDRPTILVGHSLGGLVAQLCVPAKLVVGLYLMATVPPDGLMAVNWSVAAFDPLLWGEAALATMDKPLGPDSPLQRALFSADMPHEDVVRFASKLESPPNRAILDAHQPRFVHSARLGGPRTFVLGAGRDRLIPRDAIWRTAFYHGGDYKILPDIAHALMLDVRWRSAADALVEWAAG
ncbi:MAG: alpha/beta hydrolase [Elsteraceae bacterium]